MRSHRLALAVLVALCLFGSALAKLLSEDDVADHMVKYVEKRQTSADIAVFRQILKILAFPNYILRMELSNMNKPRASATCVSCRAFLAMFVQLYKNGASKESLIDATVELCTDLRIQPRHVCRGVIELNQDIIWYLLDNQPLIKTKSICGLVLQSNDPNSCPFNDPRYEWSVDIPVRKAEAEENVVRDNEDLQDSFVVAHVSDNHIDPVYEPGGLADCDDPTCCRRGQTKRASRGWRLIDENESFMADNIITADDGRIYINVDAADGFDHHREPKEDTDDESERAGYWGDYRDCDSPWWAFEDGVDHIAENHNIDYLYYTGDVIDHGVWETTYEMITNSLNDTFNKFRDTFRDVPVYPIIGNHESQPLNQYAPSTVVDPDVSTQWLYELLWNKWKVWLPEDTRSSIMQGGFYTVLVRPGFRIVALNTNLCYVYNWWIHLDPKDPSGQFEWLVNVLLEAERARERVHILSHIASGKADTYYVCTREYTRIIRRFSNIIAAEFNGHSHNDEFKLFHKENGGEAFAVAWNGGSLTSYSNVNPNYKIYEVNAATLNLVDADTWVYNLTEANLTPDQRPRWYKEYSFREHYGILSLKPGDVEDLVRKMVTTDHKLIAEDYHKFRGKSAEPYYKGGCNKNCVRGYLCHMLRTELYDDRKCNEYWQSYNETSPYA